MDKFEKEEMMKKEPHAKNVCHDWLIHYILEPKKEDRIAPRKKLFF